MHPGCYLRETLEELGISARQFALHIGTTPRRLSLVLRGMRPVSADLALRLERALGQSAAYWVNLQARYDLAVATADADAGIRRIKRLAAARASRHGRQRVVRPVARAAPGRPRCAMRCTATRSRPDGCRRVGGRTRGHCPAAGR